MKTLRLTVLAIMFVLFSFTGKAQWVSIPDTNFATYLNNNGFSACLQGNNNTGWQMDTACGAVLSAKTISCGFKQIGDLTGIQYFDSLLYLYCSNNNLLQLPLLPAGLQELDCSFQGDDGMPGNGLTALPALPTGLSRLDCQGNSISMLPALPASLKHLFCGSNDLVALPVLPVGLLTLSFYSNQFQTCPVLPAGLRELNCGSNLFNVLPSLPDSLNGLHCNSLSLTALPALPAALTTLECMRNNLTSLAFVPSTLQYFDGSENPWVLLPAFPVGLKTFACHACSLSNSAVIPNNLESLLCAFNNLTTLPTLRDTMHLLYISNNPISCLPPVKHIQIFYFDSTNITCLPNHLTTSFGDSVTGLPLCDVFNTSGCGVYWNISGKAYVDNNSNCTLNAVDSVSDKLKMQLWRNGNLKQQVHTHSYGGYSFDTDTFGSYKVTVDTNNLPFNIICPAGGSYTSTISAADSMDYNIDFALECKPGVDLEAKSVYNLTFRPANNTFVEITAGDAAAFYGGHCAAGAGGVVTLIFNGPVSYVAPANGALIPTLNADTLTWTVADFGNVNIFNDFNIIMRTDTLAQIGQQVCFTLNITAAAADINPANNTFIICHPIVNSFDPNVKQVYPNGNIDTLQVELTYTVRFQNTGNAVAQHIYITDTLDSNIEPASFELLAYSHQPQVQIDGNALRFNFPNINLPDSFTNEPASHGYVQYKVKLKENLPIGTTINNTAFIYFDFNAPVVTNTTTNTVALIVDTTVGIRNIKTVAQVFVYPNPASNAVTITVSENMPGATITLTDVLSRKALEPVTLHNTQTATISTQTLPEGIYMLNVKANNGASVTKRLVVRR